MTTDSFVSQIKGRYPKLNEDTIGIKDMEKGLLTFSPINREKLFTAFIDNYILNRAPRWADLNRTAFHFGISRSIENPLKDAFNICTVCNTAYSAISRMCPVCHKFTEYMVSAGDKPKQFYMVREDCGQCKLYDNNGTDGVICSNFGTGKTHRLPECRDCVCHHCCWETVAIAQGLDGDKGKFDKLTSGNKWEERLLEECKQL